MTRITVRLFFVIAATVWHDCDQANEREIYTPKKKKEREMIIVCVYVCV